jgi:hypothetical protein
VELPLDSYITVILQALYLLYPSYPVFSIVNALTLFYPAFAPLLVFYIMSRQVFRGASFDVAPGWFAFLLARSS